MALDSARGIMNCGTSGRNEKAERAGTGGTSGTGETRKEWNNCYKL